jgi:hypothetical protein
MHEHKTLPKRDVKLSLKKLETLLGATPTEEDIDRSPQILEAIRNTELNAQAYSYEMVQEKRSDLNLNQINRDLNLNQIPHRTEQVLVDRASSNPDKKKRNYGREVNPKETMATLLKLQVLPDDRKATYLT